MCSAFRAVFIARVIRFVVVLGVFGVLLSGATANAQNPSFEILFNGKDLTGWKGLAPHWSVQEGAIVGETTEETPVEANTFLVWQGGDVGDFEFRCKVRFEGNNSGVQYRSELVDVEKLALKGYQADLHPKAEYFGMMYGEKTGRGIIATRGQRVMVDADGKSEVSGKVGDESPLVDTEWNDLRIIAVGNRMIHQVNGITTIDLTDKHPDATTQGKLGLQLHRGPAMKAEFRSVLLRDLEGEDADATLQAALASSEAQVNSSANVDDQIKTPVKKDVSWLTNEPTAKWIWSKNTSNGQKVWLRRSFDVKGPVKTARLYVTCDNHVELFLNGKAAGKSGAWEQAMELDVTSVVKPGKNLIAAQCQNDGGIAAFVFKMVVEGKDGSKQTLVSEKGWRVSEKQIKGWQSSDLDDQAWGSVNVVNSLGKGPWGIPNYGKGSSDGGNNQLDPLHPKNVLAPPGFVVERLVSVPEEQGSWVSMTVDPKGRIYACDQGKQGLFRITIGDDGQAVDVEKVSTGPLSDLSGAQGLLWAFDSLWFHRNGGNLFRLTDSDGDDKLDTSELIPSETGGGEHGNHAVITTEDGQAIYMDGGNHAALAETVVSRVPTWYEGHLLPRMWDANGHARGRLAPGGWVTRLDPQSKTQTLHAIGFRNQYDIALNRFGDLFAYDADMEWDLGLPWYRPTRICHAVSGADFGWRSGSGKWPTYYEDSLPPTVDIGPGSPTGVASGVGTDFPTRYQDAIYALDWTFGTIYAIHLQPDGASYQGEAEPFVFGTPLPVTDAAVGIDGSLLFTVGGRGTDSALYRVRYIGNESRAKPGGINTEALTAWQTRRKLEAFHGVVNSSAVQTAWPYLSHPDRFLRHAARIAVESQPVETWAEKALAESDPQAAITSAVALARAAGASSSGDNEALSAKLTRKLFSINASSLETSQLLGLLRAHALTFTQLGAPSEESRKAIIAQLDPLLPHADADVNNELVRVLVGLRHPGVVDKAMALIADRKAPVLPDWSTLASRNSRYGAAVNRMLENHPPTQELSYAFILRNMRAGWTVESRRAYFTFLNEAAQASGGASYGGYLTRIRDAALGNCNDEQREALEDITGESFDPVPDFEIAEIEGPGKKWDIASAMAAVRGKPDFEHGRSLYFASKCGSCHRMAGLGGNIGPDLTSIRNKFDERYVVDAIIQPSKHISDQYGSSTVLLADGTVLNGLAAENSDGSLTVYPSQPDAKPIQVAEDDIEEMKASKVSQMPEGLINTMNATEVRDLIGYLMSAGDPKDKRYTKK